MTAKSTNSVLALLPSVPKHELKQIRAALDKLEPEVDEPLLYDVMSQLLGSKVSFARFRQTKAYPHFKRNEKLVSEFAQSLDPINTNLIAKRALLRMLVDGVAQELKAQKVVLTMESLTVNLVNVERVFDHMFPDYRGSNMGSFVVNALLGGKSERASRSHKPRKA